MASKNEAYAKLAGLWQDFRQRSRELPAQIDTTPTRTVVCFRILGVGVAILLEEMNEILEVPHCTRLPRVKSWVRGLANVRGKLTPVVDFASFLGGGLTTSPKSQRVLLIERDDMSAGLIVDEVLGMRHFRVDTYSESREFVPPPLSPFVPGTFTTDDGQWILFRPDALFQNIDFMEVAA